MTLGFASEERRRKTYIEMKRTCKIPKASVARPVLQCKMLIDSANELFYDDSYDTDLTASWSLNDGVELSVPRIAVVAAPTRQRMGVIIDTIFEFNTMLSQFWKARHRCSFRQSKGSMLCS